MEKTKIRATWDMIDFNNMIVAIAVEELIEIKNNMQSQENQKNVEQLNKVIQRLETHIEVVGGLAKENLNPKCPNCKGEESTYSVEHQYDRTWKCYECHTEWEFNVEDNV